MNKSNWKTLSCETMEIGGNNFLEINLKESPEGAKLLGISKGWFNDEGQKRYKNNILLPIRKKDELIDVLSNLEDE